MPLSSLLKRRLQAALTSNAAAKEAQDILEGQNAYHQTAASAAITGTQEAETNFDKNVTIKANTLKVGSRIKIRAQGIHTATTLAETHTILLKLGTVTVASKAAIDPANNDIFYFDFEVIVRTIGAAGTIVGCGLIATGAGGSAAPAAAFLASTALDTTVDNVAAVAIDRQAAATDTDSARLDFLSVEVIPPALA